MRFLPFLLLPGVLLAKEPKLSGEQLFTMHCSACHLPDQLVVGPSLVEIRSIYRRNLPGFLYWTKNPQKKREGVVEMPSMAHIPDDQIEMIHAHILDVAKGLKEKKPEGGAVLENSETVVKRPNLLRMPMLDSGPASIAVAVDDEYSYCWDAGLSRLRYVWKGGFVDASRFWQGNGRGSPKMIGERLITEESGPLSNLSGADQPQFLGYRMKDQVPTFLYRMGQTLVSERIEASKTGLKRHFTLDPAPAKALELPLATWKGASWTSNVGKLSNGVLLLQPKEAASFTLTLIEP